CAAGPARPRCPPHGAARVARLHPAVAAIGARPGPIPRVGRLDTGPPATDGGGELRSGHRRAAQPERTRPGALVTAIDRTYVAKLLAAGDSAHTMAARGRALEDLIVYVFELVPGIILTQRNELNAFEAEEIDVAFWNEGDPAGLRLFDHILLIECKN